MKVRFGYENYEHDLWATLGFLKGYDYTIIENRTDGAFLHLVFYLKIIL